MSEKMAVEFEGVGKMYRLYRNRMESFLDITSLGRVSPWWNPKIQNFWALRNVSFKLNAGSRLALNQYASLFASFDGEFANSGHSYAGRGGIRFSW